MNTLERAQRLFDQLGVPALKLDANGCFRMAYGGWLPLYGRVMSSPPLLVLFIDIGRLPGNEAETALRAVLQTSLQLAQRSEAMLSLMPAEGIVFYQHTLRLAEQKVLNKQRLRWRTIEPAVFAAQLQESIGYALWCHEQLQPVLQRHDPADLFEVRLRGI